MKKLIDTDLQTTFSNAVLILDNLSSGGSKKIAIIFTFSGIKCS